MKIKLSTGIVLAICLAASICPGRAQTTNLTQQILQMHTFREGLVLAGNQTPSDAENKELLEVLNHLHEEWWTAGLEQFFQDHPDSPWAASLHYDYASFCRRTGRTTKALEQFEAGWDLAKNATSAQGQRLSGTILANWTDLLSSLGRLDELKKLVAIGDHWSFVNPRDREKFEGAKNSYLLMQEHPEIAYRCGTFALKAVGGVLQPGNQALESLVEVPSPTNGFSLAGLLDLAKQYGMNMVAVRRTAGQDLIVPSVIHWRQNHYAAIIGKQDDLYLVSDPTFGHQKWMPAEVINEEASGEFLIPAASQTTGWVQLALNDAKEIHGMGLPNNIQDGKDKSCVRQFNGQVSCTHCGGMPVWWVSEPYVNVWMADQPISYVTSRGEPFPFQITYKQRDTRSSSSDFYVSTAGWNNSWTSYIQCDSELPCNNTHGTGCLNGPGDADTTVYLPNGGEIDFSPFQNYDQETRTEIMYLSPIGTITQGQDNGNNGLRLVHADGSQDIYGAAVAIPVPYGDDSESDFWRTRHVDANGDTTLYEYGSANDAQRVPVYVIDPDGRTNILTYTLVKNFNLVSSVTNAYGQNAHFKYDSNGNLTNIVDAQGLSSSMTYDTNGYPTALITPYGTNAFVIYENSAVTSTNGAEGNFGGDSPPYIDRAVLATDPVGAQSLYLYQNDCSTFMSATYPSGDVPTNTPLGTLDDGGTGTNALMGACFRNSFYWGPRQYPNLSTTNMFDFTANDYLRGRMQHWLEDTNQLDLTGYLSVKQDPSPDGSTPGLLTFYDYQGKLPGHNFCAGINALPSVVAWCLPNAQTHYEYLVFDYFGNITNDVTTYTLPNGSVGTRTNQFIYSNNTYTYSFGNWYGMGDFSGSFQNSYTIPNLLTQVIGPDGNAIWSYGGFDTVTWTNIISAYDESQTNGATLTSLRVDPDYATNGLGQVISNTYTAGGNPVTIYDNWIGTTGDSNSDYGNFVATFFPGYSKVSSTTSVAGLTTTNFYNANGFLTRTIDLQIGRTNSFGYTTDGLIGSLTNELGLNLSAAWDSLLRLTSVQYPDGTSISNIYGKLDLTAKQDRLGHWTYYGYDGARHLTSITNANNAVTLLDWCGCGALTGILDALTNLTTLNYNNQGDLTNATFPDGSTLNYQYDLAARPISAADGAGRTLQFGYNNQGLVTTVSNAFGLVQGATFDIRDRPASVTDANHVTVTNSFDLLDRILTRTWPDDIGEGYGYSPQGLVSYTNRDQKVTEYGRNAAGWLMAITNADLQVIQAGYNPAGETTSLIDGLNHTNFWQFNPYGWLTNKVDGLGRNAFRFAYNPNGWLTNRWTPEKGNTSYAFDNAGNLTNVIYPTSTINYAYNADNQLTNMVDGVGTTTFSYTPVGQLASESGPWASDTVSNAYSQGLRTALNINQPSGSWSQSYGYDSAWRMTNLTSQAGAFNYGYNFQPASALVSSIVLPNGASITNGYDVLARLTDTALNNQWGHTLDGYAYTSDAFGLRTNIVRNLGLTSSSVAVGFDSIGQLTSWSAKESGGMLRQNEQLGFGFDAADNLHTRNNGGLAQTFSVDAANELSSVSRSGNFTLSGATPAPATNITVNGQPAQTYGDFTFAATNNTLANGNNTFTNIARNVYGVAVTNTFIVNLPTSVSLSSDNNGNLTNDGTRSFGYDSENQLTNVMVAGQWRSSFIYDGLNRRRIARDYSWSGSAWVETNETHYVYDGYLILQERGTNNNVLVTYTRGLELSDSLQEAGGIGGLLARTDANGSTFYHADGIGNITALMDGDENIVARYLYNPFGKLTSQWGSMAGVNEMQFSSMPQHAGLDLYAFRGYEPNFQRWLSQDPIQEMGGINLYRVVNNSPLNYADLLGLYSWNDYQNDVAGGWNMVKSGVDDALTDTEQLFTGKPGDFTPDPNSLQYLSNQAGVGNTPLTDEKGHCVDATHLVFTGVFLSVATAPFIGLEKEESAVIEKEGGLVIGKLEDLAKDTGWRSGDHTLNLPPLPPGPGRWAQNESALQAAIDLGNPIRDISPTKGGGFLDLERNLLVQNGWKFAPATGLWSP